MTNLLADKYDFLGSRVMTWCRDMKEQHCYVAPPSPYGVRSVRDRLASGDDLKVQPIEVRSPPPCSGDVELGEERVLVPEALFGLRGGGGLPQLVLECAARTLRSKLCEEEDVRTLLQQIVLVGGAADFPNIRTRVQHEVRALLREGAAPDLLAALRSPEEVFVLNPPLGKKAPLASPRFVPLIGGCVRAASSLSFDDWHSGEGVALQIQPRGVLCRGSDEHNLPALIRRRLFSQLRSGPAVFRTGGGAGEDDAWQLFGSDVSDSDEDLEEDDDPVRPEDVEMEDCGESQEDEEEDADEMDGGASADARGAHR
ncbi:unnamed protein product [Prorocentrum cordatum]|uniref:Actin-related protein 5 n=1 Tax=Prorocentrum cordatum TaxID=2364126 RepID=A0ABN9SGC6_9DINO|nr:unnamed protein product [Polarella glacialis]